jgi:hypothetical protein
VPVHETLIKDMCAANKASLEASHSCNVQNCASYKEHAALNSIDWVLVQRKIVR